MTEIGLAVPASGFAYTLDEAMEVGDEIGYPLIVRPSLHPRRRRHRHRPRPESVCGASPRSGWTPARSARSSSSGRSPGGRSTSSRSCATGPTTAWSSARSRTSIRWACTPATRSPWPRPRRCPTSSTSACATPPSPASAASAWRRAAPTSSSPLNPDNGDMVVIEMNPRVSPVRRRWRRRPPGSPSPRSPPASPSATRSTRSPTTSPARRRPASSRPSTTSSPRCRAGPSRSSPAPADVLGTADAVGGRGHGHRPHVPRVAPEGPALARARPLGPQLRPGRGAARRPRRRRAGPAGRHRHARPAVPARGGAAPAASASSGWTTATQVDPWFLDQILQIVEERGPPAVELGLTAMTPARLAPGQAPRVLRRPARLALGRHGRRGPGGAAGGRRAGHVQDGRHLRRRVRGPHAVPLLDLRGRGRGAPERRPKIVILGSGPNRIGQGIEFDYCCVHASFALRDAGFETVMINCNPETVSTDYDTSDRLYFEPLTFEDVLNVIEAERPAATWSASSSASAARRRSSWPAGLPPALVLGTSPESIDLAEDRERWNALCARLGDPPARGRHRGHGRRGPRRSSSRIGYPALVRPSYVLGGRAMEIVYDDDGLRRAMAELAGFGSLGPRGRAVGRAPGARRPLPRGRHRGRRRRPPRRAPARSSSAG